MGLGGGWPPCCVLSLLIPKPSFLSLMSSVFHSKYPSFLSGLRFNGHRTLYEFQTYSVMM